MSLWSVSIVFSAYPVGKLVCSPLAGWLASRFGRRPVLVVGMVLVSAATESIGVIPSMFGEEQLRKDPAQLLAMTVVLTMARSMQGCGLAFAQLSIFAVLGDTFPENRGLVMGTASAMIALGWTIGPPTGGFLFVLGGFQLPFLVLGFFPILSLGPLLTLWPKRAAAADKSAAAETEKAGSSSPAGPPPSWTTLLCQMQADIWVVVLSAFLFMSKWGWCKLPRYCCNLARATAISLVDRGPILHSLGRR